MDIIQDLDRIMARLRANLLTGRLLGTGHDALDIYGHLDDLERLRGSLVEMIKPTGGLDRPTADIDSDDLLVAPWENR